MLARDALRLFAARSRVASEWINQATQSLCALDPSAELLDAAEGFQSLAITNRLRELLPDEHLACRFESIAEQNEAGALLMQKLNPHSRVTLHLGFGPVAYRLKLESAWLGWQDFAEANIDTYNVCIYPEDFQWYVVRSGKHYVYPMNCDTSEAPSLESNWLRR